MATPTLNNQPFDAVFTLIESEIDDSTANPTVKLTWAEDNVGAYIQTVSGGIVNTEATELILKASAQFENSGGAENFHLTITDFDSANRIITCSTTLRGIPNGEQTMPPTQTDSSLYREHKIGRVWLCSEVILVRQLNNKFTATTTTELITVGESIDTTSGNLGVSLHTDGKYYKYHKTNYPNYQGLLLSGQILSADATATLYNLKAIVSGFSGLTNGAFVYVDDGGTFTETSSGTTELAGIARGDDTIIGVERVPSFEGNVSDSDFRIQDNADNTKQIAFEASSITTGTTRTITIPDSDGVVLTSGEANAKSNTFVVQDNSDNTKQLDFDVSGITTGNTRTITMPDEDVDLGNIGGDQFPKNVYTSPRQTFSANTVYSFTHNLGVTEADVEDGRYKVVIAAKITDQGTLLGDVYGSSQHWGGSSGIAPFSPTTRYQWFSGDPTTAYFVYFQANTLKIRWGSVSITSGGLGGRLLVIQMW
jgi:hypothetical protein